MKPLRYLTLLLLSLAGGVAPAQAADAGAASRYVEAIGVRALGVISSQALSRDQKRGRLEALFAENVDFPWVGRFVMGRYWRQATEAQKARYLAEYQKFLLLNYTGRFAEYTSGSFTVTATRDDGDDEFTVATQMQSKEVADGEPVQVDYRVRKAGRTFKIFDVIVEGVSLLTTQRAEFASVLGSRGIDYLINELTAKTSKERRTMRVGTDSKAVTVAAR